MAVTRLQALSEAPLRVSSAYETDPVGYLNQPKFLNAAVEIDIRLSPRELLGAISEIEAAAGRARSFRNAPRPLDIDILLFGDSDVHEEGLVIPHPRMLERAFVIAPLLEIDPEVRLPDGRRVADAVPVELLNGLEGTVPYAKLRARPD
jgi:2-amino-4-hydroxy-6-hydroxymethyldihydropteridine diphosphokinase